MPTPEREERPQSSPSPSPSTTSPSTTTTSTTTPSALSMKDLLASCAAATAVSTPPCAQDEPDEGAPDAAPVRRRAA
ncbi:hypothetical protein OG413_05870 [Streptomyces sp. NBC_01433]|uniref:hypothetical protein n=1 Tax=Streptomyces sp. NBC_01433 TaxID=2903864 RepID=UPI00224EDD5D|nr:hypothetical protein [Streptomyces sp. NBC_01433]MCX4674857.1 hypothetical protein [Streptomyces sp. NBC_01433]